MKTVVLSALYGQYEWPKPVPPDLGVPAILMTDDADTPAGGWEVWHQRPQFMAPFTVADPAATVPMMRHKYWKCYPELALLMTGHTDADVVIWLDASMTITEPNFVDLCLEVLGDDDWAVMKHPWRTCVYDEANFSGLLSRYDKVSLDRQSDFYRTIGHPPNWGLFATGFSVRRMTDVVKEIGDQWWWECSTRTHQDQVSLPVLFRLAEHRLKWNTNLPWAKWWHLAEHGR